MPDYLKLALLSPAASSAPNIFACTSTWTGVSFTMEEVPLPPPFLMTYCALDSWQFFHNYLPADRSTRQNVTCCKLPFARDAPRIVPFTARDFRAFTTCAPLFCCSMYLLLYAHTEPARLHFPTPIPAGMVYTFFGCWFVIWCRFVVSCGTYWLLRFFAI